MYQIRRDSTILPGTQLKKETGGAEFIAVLTLATTFFKSLIIEGWERNIRSTSVESNLKKLVNYWNWSERKLTSTKLICTMCFVRYFTWRS